MLSQIFCVGALLDTVQLAGIHPDSKTFVDMKLKHTPSATLVAFRAWHVRHPAPSAAAVRRFVDTHFDAAGSELQPWRPTDHLAQPAFLQRITDPAYRRFAGAINDRWPLLGRNMTADVALNPHLYSIIPVPHPVIVPGGRFREYYYWDSYWIVLGLLHGQMHRTVRGMLANYVHLIDRFGYVPNGGRIYYLGRSQPPLLIPMVKRYLDASGDLDFVRHAIPALEREFAYWMDAEKTVLVCGHRLARYAARGTGPRPESYREDYANGQRVAGDGGDREAFYAEVRTTAESGMEFSTRWYVNQRNGTNEGTIEDLRCRSIVPVELNAVLQWNARLLAEFHRRLGNGRRASVYRRQARRLFAGIRAVLWHNDVGAWLDWDVANGRRRDYFVPTNLAPLWTGAFDRSDAAGVSASVLRYIRRNGVDGFAAGVPNTLMESGEQWDYPNAWPPMQHMMIGGLENLRTEAAGAMATALAEKWVYTNWVAFVRTGAMYEKYSAVEIGRGGDGGEYDVQVGFGWSNGVVLDLLARYGDRISARGGREAAQYYGRGGEGAVTR